MYICQNKLRNVLIHYICMHFFISLHIYFHLCVYLLKGADTYVFLHTHSTELQIQQH